MLKKNAVLVLIVICLFLGFVLPAMADQDINLIPSLTERTTLHSRYDPDKAWSNDQITSILAAGFTMPTGGGQRSLEFFVVTQRDTMAAMRGGNPYSQALETVPCIIVIAADNKKAFYEELQEMDAGLAAGAILAQATSMGLTTCVLSITPQPQRIESVRNALNMPDSFIPVLMIAVGYPAADAFTSASADSWNDNQVHYNSYSEK